MSFLQKRAVAHILGSLIKFDLVSELRNKLKMGKLLKTKPSDGTSNVFVDIANVPLSTYISHPTFSHLTGPTELFSYIVLGLKRKNLTEFTALTISNVAVIWPSYDKP